MRTWLLAIAVLYPVLELAVLIKVGTVIGLGWILALILLTGAFGVFLLRMAGVSTAWRVRMQLLRGELPQRELMQGLLTALGAILLILPGFIGDVVGLLCVLPVTCDVLLAQLLRGVSARAQAQANARANASVNDANASAEARRSQTFGQAKAGSTQRRQPQIIEGEFTEGDRDTKK